VFVGVVTCRVADGGVAGPDSDSGERVSSLSSSESRRSSSSLWHRLVLFAGGGWVSGEGGVGEAGGGRGRAGGVEPAVMTAATAAGDDGGAGSSRAAVAVRLRLRLRQRRWQRLPAAVSVAAGSGTLQVTVMT
jgi:hypothetical protein